MYFKFLVILFLILGSIFDYLLWNKETVAVRVEKTLMVCTPKKDRRIHNNNIHLLCVPHEYIEKELD